MTENETIEISVVVTMPVPPQAMPFVVETLRNLFGQASTVEEVRKCERCSNFYIPRNIATWDTECPHCDATAEEYAESLGYSKPECAAQMLGDGYSRHWAPCTDYPDGAVVDINGRVLSDAEANIVVLRWLDRQ